MNLGKIELGFLPAIDLIELYRDKSLSPVEVARSTLERIGQLNGSLNAFSFVPPEDTIAQARASEERWLRGEPLGLLDGVPSTVKDLWMVRGWPTRKGSRAVSDELSPEDAPAVARMRENGAVIVGKTATSEFGWKGVTDSPLHGVSRNPWNLDKTCGGSSGGAAVAAACGMGTLNLGSDGAGSIRIPAAFCGVFGFKPTWGRVAAYPFGNLPMLSHSGPITRNVSDARLMFEVIAQPDPRDWLSLPVLERDRRSKRNAGLVGLRIAYSRDLGYITDIEEDVLILTDKAVRHFEELGVTIEIVDIKFPNIQSDFELIYSTGLAAMLDGIVPERRCNIDAGLLEFAEAGRRSSGTDVLNAWANRDAFGRYMNAFHQQFDILLTPQLPITAFETGIPSPKVSDAFPLAWTPFTFPFNFTGQPAAAVPCGFSENGLPVALQLVGPRYCDTLVLQVAEAFETRCPFQMPTHV